MSWRNLVFLPLVLATALVGCSDTAPTCPFTGKADEAPSAGCFSVIDGELLLVQGLNGRISLPGGLSKRGESAQCTAFRETWEETGLQLHPGKLLQVFNTGFHLYRCDYSAMTGSIDPPLRFEVSDAFYLHPEQFDGFDWRYNDQRELLQLLLRETSEEGQIATQSPH